MELERLIRLPWTNELRRNPSGRFLGRIVELAGCMTEGRDEAETLEHLHEALELWLETELERGHPIPRPGYYKSRKWAFVVRSPAKAASPTAKARLRAREKAGARR